MKEKEEQKPALSHPQIAVFSLMATIALLIGLFTGNNLIVVLSLGIMTMIKALAFYFHDRKIDLFWTFSYMAVLVIWSTLERMG